LVRTFRAIVGKPSTPTPAGTFFVEESVHLSPTAVGAPYAPALSARSTVLQEFDGGPGQIAVHGLANVGGLLGTAESHGCVLGLRRSDALAGRSRWRRAMWQELASRGSAMVVGMALMQQTTTSDL
jgi:hypothetical protein